MPMSINIHTSVFCTQWVSLSPPIKNKVIYEIYTKGNLYIHKYIYCGDTERAL